MPQPEISRPPLAPDWPPRAGQAPMRCRCKAGAVPNAVPGAPGRNVRSQALLSSHALRVSSVQQVDLLPQVRKIRVGRTFPTSDQNPSRFRTARLRAARRRRRTAHAIQTRMAPGICASRRRQGPPNEIARASEVRSPRGQSGRLASMSARTSGSSGTVRGRNRATTDPSGPSTNFSKFHMMSPASPEASCVAVNAS